MHAGDRAAEAQGNSLPLVGKRRHWAPAFAGATDDPSSVRMSGRALSSRQQLLERQSRLGENPFVVEVLADDAKSLFDRRHVQVAEEISDVVNVVKLLTDPQGYALHRQQIRR